MKVLRVVGEAAIRGCGRRGVFFSLFFLAAVGLVVYGRALDAGFVWDDYALIVDNPTIKSPVEVKEILMQDMAAGVERPSRYYRPIQTFSYVLDHAVWKLNPRGYHFTSLLLHIFVTWLFYWLLNILWRDATVALLSSLFFLLHPIHVESVTYISGRAELLGALFILLAFIFYVKVAENQKFLGRSVMVPGPFFFFLALLSNECSLVLPFLLLIYHYSFRKKIKANEFLPYVGIALFFSFWRLFFFSSSPLPAFSFSFLERLPGFFIAITNYVGLLFWPLGLHMGYGGGPFTWFDTRAIIGSAVILGIAIFLLRSKKETWLIFSVVWFFVALLPVSNIFFPLPAYMAVHWLYVPSMGFFVLLGYSLLRVYRMRRLRWFSVLCMICLSLFYSSRTQIENLYWREPIGFYEHTLSYVPDNTDILINLGIEYNNKGYRQKAVHLFIKSFDIALERAYEHNQQGVAAAEASDPVRAVRFFKRAVLSLPANNNLYRDLARLGDVSLLSRVDEAWRSRGLLYRNLAAACAEAGDSKQADRFSRMATNLPIF